jgi:hypothetical protein
MNVFSALLSLIIITSLIASILRILRFHGTKTRQTVLITLRSLFSVVLIVAFFEPSIQFERIPRISKTIPVLIDNSASMGLFSPESSIIPCINTISSVNAALSKGDQRFEFYSFGDTLKKSSPDYYSFTDSSSAFPAINSDNTLKKAHSLIIISDANWTNSVSLTSIAENKSIYYLRLPKPHPSTSINLEISSPENSLKNPVHVKCKVNGFVSDTSALTLRCISAGKMLAQKRVNGASGHIQDTFNVKLTELKPGLHIVRFQALLNDSLVAEYRHLQQIARDVFYYKAQFFTPSVDNRFLLLAFSRDSSFSSSADVTPDVLIVTGYKDDNAARLHPVAENGLVLFAGSLPCNSKKTSMTNTLITDLSNYSGFNRIQSSSLPSIPVVHNCLQAPLLRIYAWVSSSTVTRIDTFPALFTSVYSNKKALFLSLSDFWKWDFSPLVSDHGEEQAFSFSRRIVDTVKEILLSNLSATYVSYINNDIHSSTPMTFEHHIPQNFEFNEQVTIQCTVSDNSGRRLDSTVITNINGSGVIRTPFKSLPEGRYLYNTSLTGQKGTYTFSDSVFIRPDDREFLVNNQNEYIFTDIARPVTADSAFFSTILNGTITDATVPVKDFFTISRNWVLLLLLLTIYGTELLFRRYWKLD